MRSGTRPHQTRIQRSSLISFFSIPLSLPPPPRTPLNTILLGLSVLSENVKKFEEIISLLPPSTSAQLKTAVEESFELLEQLEDNSSVAITTLTDLINYDKIETKSFTIEKKDVDIWSVIEKTVSPLAIQAREKNIQMELVTQISDPSQFQSLEPNLEIRNLRLVGDAIKVGQVVRNLVSNALKFSPINGDVKISGKINFFIALILLTRSCWQLTFNLKKLNLR
jgi:signal transduction histidine kinase